jgi:amino acid transporter
VANPERGFIKSMGLTDVVLMNIVAVVGMRWIARGARAGPASVTLWILAWLAFFVPLAAAVAELSRRYPKQGGVYVWVRRAFGSGHGFICGWCLWVNNLFYFPSVLLFGAANFAAMGGARWQGLGDSRWFAVVFVLAGSWIAALVSIVGLRTGKWLQNVGTAGVWVPAGLLIGCGVFAAMRYLAAMRPSGVLRQLDLPQR